VVGLLGPLEQRLRALHGLDRLRVARGPREVRGGGLEGPRDPRLLFG